MSAPCDLPCDAPRQGLCRSSVLLCVIAAAATGPVVFWKGAAQPRATEPYTATAAVIHRPAEPAYTATSFEGEQVVRELLSDETIARALDRFNGPTHSGRVNATPPPSAATVAGVRSRLRVREQATASGEFRASISTTDDDARTAVQRVNAVAQAYADRYAAEAAHRAAPGLARAEAACEHARQEFLNAKARFDQYMEERFSRESRWVDECLQWLSLQPAPESPPRAPVAPTSPQVVEDRDRAELSGALDGLLQARAALLEDLTPLHPKVQEIEGRIAEVRARLEKLPDSRADVPPPVDSPVRGPALAAPSRHDPRPARLATDLARARDQAIRGFRERKLALDRAEHEYHRLANEVRLARARQSQVPTVQVELAQAPQIGAGARQAWGMLAVALVAAMCVALGTWLVSAGLAIDPPIARCDQAEKTIGAPVLATIALSDAAPMRRVAPPSRLPRIAAGLLLVAGCVGALAVWF